MACKFGLDLPGQLSVAGFDNAPIAGMLWPERIPRHLLDHELVVCNSTARPAPRLRLIDQPLVGNIQISGYRPRISRSNYVALLPGETRRIDVQCPADSASCAKVALRGWNAEPLEVPVVYGGR